MSGNFKRSFVPVITFALAVLALTPFFPVCGVFAGAEPAESVAAATNAAGMTVMEANSGRVLASYNVNKRMPMASTTKVVTAIVVIENCRLDAVVKIPAAAVGIEGSSIYLQKDEPLSVEDLLHGLMLQSGNDCAAALAIHTAGSIEKFAAMMNDFAARVGAENSNFVNPHGLHHKEHYTTAGDLCRMACYAMRNPVFKRIVGTKRYKCAWAGRDYPRVIVNKNKILNLYEGGNGVKTGFTKAAGRCLVASAERDGMQLVSVVLNCGPMFSECMRLMDNAFESYGVAELLAPQKHLGELPVSLGAAPYVRVYCYNPFSYPLTPDERGKVKYVCELPEKVKAPVAKDQPLGRIKIYLGDELLHEDEVRAVSEVRSVKLKDRLGDLVKDGFVTRDTAKSLK